MSSRWRLWFLYLLTLCIFISALEVNTREIVNRRGDYCQAYLPLKFVANSIQSTPVSAQRSIEQLRQTKRLDKPIFSLVALGDKFSTQAKSHRVWRIYLRCRQWRI